MAPHSFYSLALSSVTDLSACHSGLREFKRVRQRAAMNVVAVGLVRRRSYASAALVDRDEKPPGLGRPGVPFAYCAYGTLGRGGLETDLAQLATFDRAQIAQEIAEIFQVQGSGFRGCVAAARVVWHEDDGDYDTPSYFSRGNIF